MKSGRKEKHLRETDFRLQTKHVLKFLVKKVLIFCSETKHIRIFLSVNMEFALLMLNSLGGEMS